MKTLEQRQWCRSSVFFVNCEHTLHFFLITDFEKANIWWVHIEKKTLFKKGLGHVLCCSILSAKKNN